MLSFREYVRLREASFDVTNYTQMKGNPESWAYRGLGKAAGVVPAALSGTVPATIGIIKALRGHKARAYSAAASILDYLAKNENWRQFVLSKLDQAIGRIENAPEKVSTGAAMGTIQGGGGVPNVNAGGHSTLGEIGSAVWKGVVTSARNVMDTLFSSSGVSNSGTLKFQQAFKEFFQALGQMNKETALPLLNNLEHVMSEPGATWHNLETSIWE